LPEISYYLRNRTLASFSGLFGWLAFVLKLHANKVRGIGELD
jgi:hypothetical protein